MKVTLLSADENSEEIIHIPNIAPTPRVIFWYGIFYQATIDIHVYKAVTGYIMLHTNKEPILINEKGQQIW